MIATTNRRSTAGAPALAADAALGAVSAPGAAPIRTSMNVRMHSFVQ